MAASICGPTATGIGLDGQLIALFVIVLAAAEAAVALAITLNFYNNHSTVDVDQADELKRLMDRCRLLPKLLALAWLLPLASFTLIVFFGPRMGHAGTQAGHVATGAILIAACFR